MKRLINSFVLVDTLWALASELEDQLKDFHSTPTWRRSSTSRWRRRQSQLLIRCQRTLQEITSHWQVIMKIKHQGSVYKWCHHFLSFWCHGCVKMLKSWDSQQYFHIFLQVSLFQLCINVKISRTPGSFFWCLKMYIIYGQPLKFWD